MQRFKKEFQNALYGEYRRNCRAFNACAKPNMKFNYDASGSLCKFAQWRDEFFGSMSAISILRKVSIGSATYDECKARCRQELRRAQGARCASQSFYLFEMMCKGWDYVRIT